MLTPRNVMKLSLPSRFVEDRLDRDLPCGRTTRYRRQIIVQATATIFRDMAEDADYQARWTDSEDRSLKRSAAKACELIVALLDREGLPPPRLGLK